jgi:hypothetical protein
MFTSQPRCAIVAGQIEQGGTIMFLMAFRRFVFYITTFCFLGVGMTTAAYAGMVSTQDALKFEQREAALTKVDVWLQREDVSNQMIALGVDPADAQARVASLSTEELEQLTTSIDSMPAGGDLLALVGAVFVVLLVLELVGVTDVFTRA